MWLISENDMKCNCINYNDVDDGKIWMETEWSETASYTNIGRG